MADQEQGHSSPSLPRHRTPNRPSGPEDRVWNTRVRSSPLVATIFPLSCGGDRSRASKAFKGRIFWIPSAMNPVLSEIVLSPLLQHAQGS